MATQKLASPFIPLKRIPETACSQCRILQLADSALLASDRLCPTCTATTELLAIVRKSRLFSIPRFQGWRRRCGACSTEAALLCLALLAFWLTVAKN